MVCARTWLVTVDRQALATWQASFAEPPALTDEVGEHVRLATFATPLSEAELLRSVFVRFALPVAASFSVRAPEAAQDEALQCLAAQAGTAQVLAVRRYARRFVAEFAEKLATRAGHLPTLALALSDHQGFAGLVTDPALLAFPPGFDAAAPDDASRAAAKIRESLQVLALAGVPVRRGRWLDLGAFPGGITRALRTEHGATVFAIDRNPPNQALSMDPGVTYWQGDAAAFDRPEEAASAVGLACDINGPPLVAARAAARFVRLLPEGAVVAHTIKLPRWAAAAATVAAVDELFATAGAACVSCRHLPANRQEVAWLGVRGAARGA